MSAPCRSSSHFTISAPSHLAGRADALFERHLWLDAVVDPAAAYERQRFEALARAVRDILSQRWIKTLRTYDDQDLKRIYYMSMEFRSASPRHARR
jgi:starch phosphorylase